MASPPEPAGPASYLRPGHSPDILRKLRRGHWPVEDELDLHGLTRAQASQLLGEFLDEAAGAGLRCVRIVHGKGQGLLRDAVRASLAARGELLAYLEPPPREGGSGAVLVLLRNPGKS